MSYGCHCLCITKQDPQLDEGKTSNPRNCEQSNPFDTDCGSEEEATCDQPEPPCWRECMRRSLFMLVGEACPSQNRQSGEYNQRRIEKDQT